MRRLGIKTASIPSQQVTDSILPLPTATLVCLAAVGCYLVAQLVFVVGVPFGHIAPFWPVTGFLSAVLLLAPKRIWPFLIVSGLGAVAIADLRGGTTIVAQIWFSLGDLVVVLIATFGINLLFKGKPHLGSVDAFAKFLAVAVVLGPCISAFLGAHAARGSYWLEWRIWFFAAAFGFLTVTPAILTWTSEGRAWARKSRNYLELSALIISLVAVGYLAFMRTGGRETPALLYSLVPLLLWAALRLGLKGVCTSMFLVAFLSIWGAARDRGPFRGQEPFNNELSLQLFLFFAAIPFMVLAVLAEQQKQAEGDRIQMLEAIAHLNRVASMGQMAASLAHELAQPLASILNNAQAGTQFASQPEPNVEEIRGAFADIIEEDRRARVVVQNTRAMFQRQEFACTQVNLNGIVTDVTRLVRNEALRRGVQIRVVPCPDAVVVVGEATALQQVILNLINNGMDALQELPYGSRILTLTTGIPPDSNFGTVLVEDNGCGITKENRQKLFTPFFTTKTEGMGMGLSICRSLIESFGGHITLVDRSGPGTAFLVEVPLAAEQGLATPA
jgi:signal transduction histidine kinase